MIYFVNSPHSPDISEKNKKNFVPSCAFSLRLLVNKLDNGTLNNREMIQNIFQLRMHFLTKKCIVLSNFIKIGSVTSTFNLKAGCSGSIPVPDDFFFENASVSTIIYCCKSAKSGF